MKKNQKKNPSHQPRQQQRTAERRSLDLPEKKHSGDDDVRQYTVKRAHRNHKAADKTRNKKRRRKALIAIGCILLIGIGYIIGDVSIIRHETAMENAEEYRVQEGDLTSLSVEVKALYRESISLDGAVMLSSVMEETKDSGYSAVAFDAKRADGTIGYQSSLALVDTFNAIVSPSSALKRSVEQLRENDIMPIARISCYLDNVAPLYAPQMAAVTADNATYMDGDGNTYLNPDSEMTYHYIRDIIKECSSCGVTVFLLADCDLPAEIADSYGDGFAALSDKLNAEIGADVKLLYEVPVAIEKGAEEDEKETDTNNKEPRLPNENDENNKNNNNDNDGDNENGNRGKENADETRDAVKSAVEAFPPTEENQVYMITSVVSAETLKPYLEEAGITSYIIREV